MKFSLRMIGRTIVYLPVLISAVIMGYMWYYLLQYDGALNELLALFGGGKVQWLANANLARLMIVTVNTLQFSGISLIIYLAGLQGIPIMYYEAASIDGTNAFQTFFKITLPLLYPSIVTAITLNLIGGLKLFDVIKALTGGGPGYSTNSLATLLHNTYFGSQMAGYASAIGLLLFYSILLFTLILQFCFKKGEVRQ